MSSSRVEISHVFSARGCRAVAEVVEQRHAVRLGPDAHRARAGDMAVVHLDIGLAVEHHADLFSGELHPQRVPDVPGHRRVDVLDRVAPSVLRVVEGHVVLERVGARDVIVVAVLPAPHEASGLVLAAGGLVWRWKDGDNYYVARANALENNVSLYYTENGRRNTIKYVDAPVPGNVWHTLPGTGASTYLIVLRLRFSV